MFLFWNFEIGHLLSAFLLISTNAPFSGKFTKDVAVNLGCHPFQSKLQSPRWDYVHYINSSWINRPLEYNILASYTHYSESFDGSRELSHSVLKILKFLKAYKNDLKHHYKDKFIRKIDFLGWMNPKKGILTTFEGFHEIEDFGNFQCFLDQKMRPLWKWAKNHSIIVRFQNFKK